MQDIIFILHVLALLSRKNTAFRFSGSGKLQQIIKIFVGRDSNGPSTFGQIETITSMGPYII